jgi:hypothetical protein
VIMSVDFFKTDVIVFISDMCLMSDWLIFLSVTCVWCQTDWYFYRWHVFDVRLTDIFIGDMCLMSGWLIFFSIRVSSLILTLLCVWCQTDWYFSVSESVHWYWLYYVFDVRLTDIFQYQSQFVDTDFITRWDQMENVKITNKICFSTELLLQVSTRGSPEPALLTWIMHCLGFNQFVLFERKKNPSYSHRQTMSCGVC